MRCDLFFGHLKHGDFMKANEIFAAIYKELSEDEEKQDMSLFNVVESRLKNGNMQLLRSFLAEYEATEVPSQKVQELKQTLAASQ